MIEVHAGIVVDASWWPCVRCGGMSWRHFSETPNLRAFIVCYACGHKEQAIEIGRAASTSSDGLVKVEITLAPWSGADEPITVEPNA